MVVIPDELQSCDCDEWAGLIGVQLQGRPPELVLQTIDSMALLVQACSRYLKLRSYFYIK
jgi:hypothetical protein